MKRMLNNSVVIVGCLFFGVVFGASNQARRVQRIPNIMQEWSKNKRGYFGVTMQYQHQEQPTPTAPSVFVRDVVDVYVKDSANVSPEKLEAAVAMAAIGGRPVVLNGNGLTKSVNRIKPLRPSQLQNQELGTGRQLRLSNSKFGMKACKKLVFDEVVGRYSTTFVKKKVKPLVPTFDQNPVVRPGTANTAVAQSSSSALSSTPFVTRTITKT